MSQIFWPKGNSMIRSRLVPEHSDMFEDLCHNAALASIDLQTHYQLLQVQVYLANTQICTSAILWC